MVSNRLYNIFKLLDLYKNFSLGHFIMAHLIIHLVDGYTVVCCRPNIMCFLVTRNQECSHQPSSNMQILFYLQKCPHNYTWFLYCIMSFEFFDNWIWSNINTFNRFFLTWSMRVETFLETCKSLWTKHFWEGIWRVLKDFNRLICFWKAL